MKKRICSIFMAVELIAGLVFGNGMLVSNEAKASDLKMVYNAKEDFGSADWKYEIRDVATNAYTEMGLSGDGSMYLNGSNYFGRDWMSTGGNNWTVETVVTFVAPRDGNVKITSENGIANMGPGYNGAPGAVAVAKVWGKEGKELGYYESRTTTPTETPEIAQEVKAGDIIRFIVGGPTADNNYVAWVPIVTYDKVEEGGEKDVYNAREDFGSADWKYEIRDVATNAYTEMGLSGDGSMYLNGSNYFGRDWMSTGGNNWTVETVVTFVAPRDGNVKITSENGIANMGPGYNGAPGAVAVAKVWDKEGKELGYYESRTTTPTETPEIAQEVKAGDIIRFIVGGPTADNNYVAWVPIVTYDKVEEGGEKDVYNAREDFGSADWRYETRDVATNIYTEMGLNSDKSMYLNGANYVTRDWMSTGGNNWTVETVVTFVAPRDGNIKITSENGIANMGPGYNGNPVAVAVAKVWDKEGKELGYYESRTTTPTETPEIAQEVKAGDIIRFIVGGPTADNNYVAWVPIVTYDKVEEGGGDEDNENVYNARKGFGTADWKYETRDVATNAYTEMGLSGDGSMYLNGANYVTGDWMSTGGNNWTVETVVSFIAPYSGTVKINSENGIANMGPGYNGAPGAVAVAKVWDKEGKELGYYESRTTTPTETSEIVQEVKAGDIIRFIVGGPGADNNYVAWVPIVTYDKIDEGGGEEGGGDEDNENVYNAKKGFGTADWKYEIRDVKTNVYTEMSLSEDGSMYLNGSNYFGKEWMSTGGNDWTVETVVSFIAPHGGSVKITSENGVANMGLGYNENPTSVAVAKVWDKDNKELGYYESRTTAPTETPEITLEVKAGDVIRFIVGGPGADNNYVAWVPVVTYDRIDEGGGDEGGGDEGDKEDEKPLYVYDASEMGKEWSYFERTIEDGVYTALVYDKESGSYKGANGTVITATGQNTGNSKDIQTARVFTAPYSGTVKISFKDKAAIIDKEAGMVYFRVWRGAKRAEEVYLAYLTERNTKLDSFEIKVKEGEEIYFVAGSFDDENVMVETVPVVSYCKICAEEEGTGNETGDGTKDDNGSPETGDSIFFIPMVCVLLSVMGMAVLTFEMRRRRNRQKC